MKISHHFALLTFACICAGCGSNGTPATDQDRVEVRAPYVAAQELVRRKLGDPHATFPELTAGLANKDAEADIISFKNDSVSILVDADLNLETKRVDRNATVTGHYRTASTSGTFTATLDNTTGEWVGFQGDGIEIQSN